MPSNTKENGFETLIVDTLVNSNGYEQGITTEYNKQYAIDEDRLFRFLMSTQKKAMDELHILDSDLEKDRFFKQLDKKLKSDGVIELLRKGLRYKHLRLDLFYVRPSVHNPEAAALYEKNIHAVCTPFIGSLCGKLLTGTNTPFAISSARMAAFLASISAFFRFLILSSYRFCAPLAFRFK